MISNITGTAFAKKVIGSFFKLKNRKLQIDASVIDLLRPSSDEEGESDKIGESEEYKFKHQEFVDADYIPTSLLKFIGSDELKEIETTLKVERKANLDAREEYLKQIENNYYIQIKNASTCNYERWKSNYSDIDNLSSQQITEKAKVHAVLDEMIPQCKDAIHRNIFFNALQLYLTVEELKIPAKSEDSFRKYIARVKKVGLPTALIHGLTGAVSNRLKLNQLMKDLITILVMENPLKSVSTDIRDEIENIIDEHPHLLKNESLFYLGDSTIRNYMASLECKNNASYAKDNPREFKQRITGYLKFLPPSSPLVKVCIDGYLFQIVCKDDSGQRKVMQLIGVCIMDARTKAMLGVAIGRSESSELIVEALKDYFVTTKGAMAREIVMDGHLAFQSARLKNFMETIERDGVVITHTKKNPNRNPIERAFLSFQNKVLGHSFSYIGPGIKSKTPNAHPFKTFMVTVRSSEYLKSEDEMTRLLYWLMRNQYNLETKNVFNIPPGRHFKDETKNPLKTYAQEHIARMLYECHNSTVMGCGIIIKSTPSVFVYKNKTEHIAEFVNGMNCEAFVDPNDRSVAYLFKAGERKFVCTMDEIAKIPSAEFDRTEEHYDFLRLQSKDTRKIIEHFEKRAETREAGVTKYLNEDFRVYTRKAMQKKNFDSQDTAYQVGLDRPTAAPPIFHANKSTIKRKGKKKGDGLGFSIESTI